MKIQLDYKIDIEVKEGNKVKEKLSVFYREFTLEEKKSQDNMRKKFETIFKKAQKLEKKKNALEKKSELFELNGNYEKAIEAISKRDDLNDELEEIIESLDDLGGGNQDEFVETKAKERFETLVSGKDKDRLEEIGNTKGFVYLMHMLDVEKEKLEKKQSGE